MDNPSDPVDPQRGEVWRVNFDPAVGDEMGKPRPAVIIGEDSVGVLELRIVVPITKWNPSRPPWMVMLVQSKRNGLTKTSSADAFQVKSVSVDRCEEKIGVLMPDTIKEIASAVALCVGFEP